MTRQNGEIRIVDLSSDKDAVTPSTAEREEKSEPWQGLVRIRLRTES